MDHKKDIENREDLVWLLEAFYSKAFNRIKCYRKTYKNFRDSIPRLHLPIRLCRAW